MKKLHILYWIFTGLYATAVGLPVPGWALVLLFPVVLGLSYFFYHKRLKAASLNVK